MSRSFKIGFVLTATLVLFMGVGSAAAGPVLFAGSITTRQSGPWSPPGTVMYVVGGGVSVTGSSPASFTVPASYFPPVTLTTPFTDTYNTSGVRTIRHQQSGSGAFAPFYLTPGVTLLYSKMRLEVGPYGFGGNMRVMLSSTTAETRTLTDTSPYGTIFLSRRRQGRFGTGPWATTNPSAVMLMASGTLMGTTSTYNTTYTTTGTTVRAPWATGTVQVTFSTGGFSSAITSMASDNRTAMGHWGMISLVTPHLTRASLPNARTGALISRLDIHFSPEPGRLTLLASGLLGLSALHRLRERHLRQG